MRKQKEVDDLGLLALSAFLQSQLDVIVTTATFRPVGVWWLPPLNCTSCLNIDDDFNGIPSSLITIGPYTLGGLRRLVLNVKSQLVHDMVTAFQQGHVGPVKLLAKAMIRSGSLPVKDIDTGNVSVRWRATPGVIACPHELSIRPEPNVEIVEDESSESVERTTNRYHKILAIWPLRICSIHQPKARGDPNDDDDTTHLSSNNSKNSSRGVTNVIRAHELWWQRDQGLQMEFAALLAKQTPSILARCRRWMFAQTPPAQHEATLSLKSWKTGINSSSTTALVTMAPSLPVYAVASFLTERNLVPLITAIPQAASWLLRHDRMFALSIFFGFPLMDRTRVLPQTVRIQYDFVSRLPPTLAQCRAWLKSSKATLAERKMINEKEIVTNEGETKEEECRALLRHCMLERAQAFWAKTEEQQSTNSPPGSIMVAWSGGIDSTATLCAFLETSNVSDRIKRLIVLLDDESMKENPNFYKQQVMSQNLKIIPRNGEPLSTHAVRLASGEYTNSKMKTDTNSRNILITGELGDQLFGSSKMAAAFYPPPDRSELLQGIWYQNKQFKKEAPPPTTPFDNVRQIFIAKGLQSPWEETIIPALECIGLLGEGGCQAWKKWIQPQLDKSPISITSTFDFLWWINFSCKWQNVSFRCLHDGGLPLLSRTKGTRVSELTGCIRHFFDDSNFECWSCISEFHKFKFPDLKAWSTFKEPLKYFIRSFDCDETYYLEKKKVGSLNFGAPEGPESYTNQFYGAVTTIPEQQPEILTNPDPAPKVRALLWGKCGMIPPLDHGLGYLLTLDARSQLELYPNESSNIVTITTTKSKESTKKPFAIAPFSVSEEEVEDYTAACSGLLDPDIIRNRTILVLNAGKGMFCHWALCMGAKRVIAVATDIADLENTRLLLEQGEKDICWPILKAMDEPLPQSAYDIHLAAKDMGSMLDSFDDNSVDVILLIGWPDSSTLSLLSDMARVSSYALMFDLPHSEIALKGILDDPDGPVDSELEKRFISDGVMKAATRPWSRQISDAPIGILPVLPSEGTNRANTKVPSRLAVEHLMKTIGWQVNRVLFEMPLSPAPQYTSYSHPPGITRTLPPRYLLQAFKPQSASLNRDTTAKTKRSIVSQQINQESPTGGEKFLSWTDLQVSSQEVQYDTMKGDAAPFSMQAWGTCHQSGPDSSSSKMSYWSGGGPNGSVFGFVYKGPAKLSIYQKNDNPTNTGDVKRSFVLCDGMYFAAPGYIQVEGGTGSLQLVKNHSALFQIGGPVELGCPGRLPYIDGCSDTLLVAPVVKGSPCLNHLHFPPNISQTQHTHPSGRSGMIVNGSGICVCEDEDGVQQISELKAGVAFVIPTDVRHAFVTNSGEGMDVIAFHPDSDFGPTGKDHPMVNRTMVNGISASKLTSIQTKCG